VEGREERWEGWRKKGKRGGREGGDETSKDRQYYVPATEKLNETRFPPVVMFQPVCIYHIHQGTSEVEGQRGSGRSRSPKEGGTNAERRFPHRRRAGCSLPWTILYNITQTESVSVARGKRRRDETCRRSVYGKKGIQLTIVDELHRIGIRVEVS